MILLENGRFYLPGHPNTNALLINDGCIQAVGDAGLANHYSTDITHRYNLKGRTVWPGLTDAHIHLTSYGLNLTQVDCDTGSLEECLNHVEQMAARLTGDAWITGHGWNQNNWGKGYGTAVQLDSVSHGRPVFLTAKSLHAAWANSAAMQLAGVNADTVDPPGGRILRDTSGNPTGIFLEKAELLVRKVIPKRSRTEILQSILAAQASLNKMGITSVHDFDALDRLDFYRELEAAGQLHLRILKAIPSEDHEKALTTGCTSGVGDSLVHVGPYKFFMDGALGPHTAAMIAPYEDDPTNLGILNYSAEVVVSRCQRIMASGSSISIHAIGDRANQEAIDAFRQLRDQEKGLLRKPASFRIEHVQLLSPMNLMDFKQLDIHASMQPIHATSDMEMADKYWGSRSRLSYAWKSLLDHGARLAFGSDAPVESPNPFRGIHAAVTRQRADGSPGDNGWIPNERISLKAALDAYTTGPSELNQYGINTGKLEPGFAADLIVLDVDPFMERAQELHQVKPIASMFAGKWLWADQGIDL
jgi:predicted amidohydrolase YtcJ